MAKLQMHPQRTTQSTSSSNQKNRRRINPRRSNELQHLCTKITPAPILVHSLSLDHCRSGDLARVAELADALASGASDSNIVQVQPLSRAPHIDIYKHMWYNIQHKLCLIISSRKAIFVCLTSLSCQNPPLPPPSEAPFHLRNASFAQGYHLAYAAQKENKPPVPAQHRICPPYS